MRGAYTSEDYAEAQRDLRNYLRTDEADSKHRRIAGIVSAALQMAVKVMQPGVIEGAVGKGALIRMTPNQVAARIRTALTGDRT